MIVMWTKEVVYVVHVALAFAPTVQDNSGFPSLIIEGGWIMSTRGRELNFYLISDLFAQKPPKLPRLDNTLASMDCCDIDH